MGKRPSHLTLRDRVLAAAGVGENDDWEFKSSKGGFPGSFWETYSAMANSAGGTIVLGASGKDEKVSLDGVDAQLLEKHKKTLWDGLGNKGVISRNLLASSQVEGLQVDSGWLLAVHIPQASRRERPVYKGQNPFGGTFKRHHEGDYRCSDEEVRRMFADASDIPADARILDGFKLSDLDRSSIRGFRNRFASTRPDHPWLALGDRGLLEKMGAWRKDNQADKEGMTLAGMLMFGKHQGIISPEAAPAYAVDYRDYRGRENPGDRWTDRLFPDGTWEANLFQFYQRCWPRLIADIKVPFVLKAGQRIDETPVHVALREALINTLIHADYSVGGGIVVERYDDRYEFSNPGTLLVSEAQLRRGGVSECRNRALQRMFMLIGAGEQAGSGYARIQEGWKSQHWRAPLLATQSTPDRVRLTMPMVSLMPHETFAALQRAIGASINELSDKERLALATAAIEDVVTNTRMQDLVPDHPADITKMLRGLVNRDLLEAENHGRWMRYKLARRLGNPGLFKPSPTGGGGPTPTGGGVAPTEAEMETIASRVRGKTKADRTLVEQTILDLCRGQFVTTQKLSELLGRGSKKLRENYLTPMVNDGRLERLYPASSGRYDQAYRTTAATLA
jgi:ATP-dependent DNA helicase RecG